MSGFDELHEDAKKVSYTEGPEVRKRPLCRENVKPI